MLNKGLYILVVWSMITAGLGFNASAQAQGSYEHIRLNNDAVRALGDEDYGKAIKLLERSLKLKPGYKNARANLAIAYNNQALAIGHRDPKRALKLFRKSWQTKPNNWSTRLNIEAMIKLNGKDPKKFEDRIEFARDCVSSGDKLGAIYEYKAALAIKDDPDARRKLSMLENGSQNVAAIPPTPTRVSPRKITTIQTTTNTTKDTPIKDKWALIVGISKFKNPSINLKYSAKDARDFYNFLVNEAGFKKDHVLLLLDENATRENIMMAFGDLFLPAVSQPGDLVVVYVSTHGTPATVDKGGKNYIVAHDTNVKSLYATGVNMDELSERIKDGVKTNRALIIMDTCYSGAGVPGHKGVFRADNFDADKIAVGCGQLVITSSSPNERSWESRVYQNGVFTKYLLEALRKKDKRIDVKTAFNDVKKNVAWEVQNAFGQPQHPQLGGDWKGKGLILSAPATEPRRVFNPDLLELIKRTSSATATN